MVLIFLSILSLTQVENLPLNFTVAIDDSWNGDEVEVFWETNAVYVKSLDQLGQRVVFARDGETNQTVNLEASLIGVYTLRCFCIAWSLFTWGNKIFILSYFETQCFL